MAALAPSAYPHGLQRPAGLPSLAYAGGVASQTHTGFEWSEGFERTQRRALGQVGCSGVIDSAVRKVLTPQVMSRNFPRALFPSVPSC